MPVTLSKSLTASAFAALLSAARKKSIASGGRQSQAQCEGRTLRDVTTMQGGQQEVDECLRAGCAEAKLTREMLLCGEEDPLRVVLWDVAAVLGKDGWSERLVIEGNVSLRLARASLEGQRAQQRGLSGTRWAQDDGDPARMRRCRHLVDKDLVVPPSLSPYAHRVSARLED